MRSVLIAVAALAAGAALLAGCGYEGTVSPTPNTVEGNLPKPTAVTGDAAAGKAVFVSTGCGSCHVFAPAGTKGTVGPSLDNLPRYAEKANQGSLEDFTRASIVDPDAYVESGYPKGIMPKTYGTQLSQKRLADLVAFLTQKS